MEVNDRRGLSEEGYSANRLTESWSFRAEEPITFDLHGIEKLQTANLSQLLWSKTSADGIYPLRNGPVMDEEMNLAIALTIGISRRPDPDHLERAITAWTTNQVSDADTVGFRFVLTYYGLGYGNPTTVVQLAIAVLCIYCIVTIVPGLHSHHWFYLYSLELCH